MKRAVLLLIVIAAVGCAHYVRNEKTDNPKVTPTSSTGVTSTKGQNVYEKIPLPARSTAK
jgi:hypothetical protein